MAHGRTDFGPALVVHDVLHILVAEGSEGAENRQGSALAQAAEGHALDHLGQLLQAVQILQLAFTGNDLLQISSIRLVPSRQGTHLPQDSRWVKLIKKRATSTMQGVLVHDHQAAGTDDGAVLLDGVEVQGHVQVLLGETAPEGRRSARP